MPEDTQEPGGYSAEGARHLHRNALRAVSLVAEAVELLVTAGNKALSIGQIGPAISALRTACDLVRYVDNPALHGIALEALLTVLVEAGDIGPATSLATSVDELECTGLETETLIMLRVQLARADLAAGLPAHGLARVADARALLAGDQVPRLGPLLDALESCLVSQTSSDADGSSARRLAHGVLSVAGEGGQVTGDSISARAACHAWEVLGVIARRDDLTESTACFRVARLLAQQHRLPFHRLYVQLELGTNEWASRGEVSRLKLVRHMARRIGAVGIACAAEATTAVDLILRGQYATATTLIEQCRVSAAASDLVVTMRWLAVARGILNAHQGNRQDMERALSECTGYGGMRQVRPFTQLLANAFCSLLEEDHDRACQELNEAALYDEEAPGPYPL